MGSHSNPILCVLLCLAGEAVFAPASPSACEFWDESPTRYTYQMTNVIRYDAVELVGNLMLTAVAVSSPPDSYNSLVVSRLGATPAIPPVILDSVGLPQSCRGLALHQHRVLIALGSDGLAILDISDPENLPDFYVPWGHGSCRDVAVAEDVACVVEWDGFRLRDLADPVFPWELSYLPLQEGRSVVTQGGFAYVASGNYGLRIFDIRDPEWPVEVATRPLGGAAFHVAVKDDRAYLSGPNLGLTTLDISDPAWPTVLQAQPQVGIPGMIAIGRGHIYVVDNQAIPLGTDYLSAIHRFALPANGLPESLGYNFENVVDFECLTLAKEVLFFGEISQPGTTYLYAAVEACPEAATGVPLTRSVARLHRPEPNPFNPRTRIDFVLPEDLAGRLVAYDVAGRRVATVWQGSGSGSRESAIFTGRDRHGRPLPSGVYRLVLEDDTGRPLATQSATLLR